MLQRLPRVLAAQVKTGNTSENLLNEIRQITYSLHIAKEITKKLNNNIINLINLWNKIDTIFMNLKILGDLILKDYHLILQIK